jgi:hypothetical protein
MPETQADPRPEYVQRVKRTLDGTQKRVNPKKLRAYFDDTSEHKSMAYTFGWLDGARAFFEGKPAPEPYTGTQHWRHGEVHGYQFAATHK